MKYSISTRLVFTALVAVVAACADSTAPTAALSDAVVTRDAANDAADATVQDIGEMLGGEALAGLPMASAPAQGIGGGGCSFSAAAGRFVCPTITNQDGLTLDRSYAVYAGGAVQSSYSATATDSINYETSLSGTLSRDGRTAWLNTMRTMTVSGLAGAETQRTWNGVGTRSDSAHIVNDGVARRTRLHSIDRISSVVYALPHSANPFPLSGTITHDITLTTVADNGSGRKGRTSSRHVEVTFNGTQTASVLVGQTPCTLDLVSRKLTCE